jgi:hypothetical protein
VAFLWTNFATSEVAPAAEPRQFSQNRVEPTLQESVSSTSSVGVEPYLSSIESNSTQAFGTKDYMSPERQAGNGQGTSVPSVRPGVGANAAAGGLKPQGIAWLPLKVSAELLILSGQSGGTNLESRPSAGNPPMIASIGLLPPPASDASKFRDEPGNRLLLTPAPSLTMTRLPEVSSISGRDLLLHFSIGDNGCYFP